MSEKENPGDVSPTNVEPAMPGPRVMSPDNGPTMGSSITLGFGYRDSIADVDPADIGADTQGPGQVKMQHPKTPAGRGTRFG
jgi:hypothetical protein